MRAVRHSLLAATALLGLLLTGCTPAEDSPAATADLIRVPTDAATLAEASDRIAPGGMILIEPGIYRETLTLTTPDVTVRGLDRNTTIIDGEGVRPAGIESTADGTRIENLTVRNTTFYGVLITGLRTDDGPSAHNGAGYEPFDPATHPPLQRFSISHVTAHNNGLYGIYAFNSQHGVITESYASGSADSGFYVGQCRDCDIVVSNNVAERNAIGFENANASGPLTVVGNRFSGNRVGMTLISNHQEAYTPQSGNVVAANLIIDNTSDDSPAHANGAFGIGVGIAGGTDNQLRNNHIAGNPVAGISLTNTEDLPASANRFDSNTFSSNGVDIANTSASRAPADSNCSDSAVTSLPTHLLDTCDGTQPTAPADQLPRVTVPPGVSFLRVTAPAHQPGMADPETVPARLPDTVRHPDADTVPAPGRDHLLARVTP